MHRCGSAVQRSLMNDRHYGGGGPALQKVRLSLSHQIDPARRPPVYCDIKFAAVCPACLSSAFSSGVTFVRLALKLCRCRGQTIGAAHKTLNA